MMPSLREKVTTYFRQFSFIAEARDVTKSPHKSHDEGNFIIKYLEGQLERKFTPGPDIYNGCNPTDLPEWQLAVYPQGSHTITAACTGPDDGLTGIKRCKLHLNANYADDIDFIDTIQENDDSEIRNSTSMSLRFSNRLQRTANGRRTLPITSLDSTNDKNANKMAAVRIRRNLKESSSKLQFKNEENLNKSLSNATTFGLSTNDTANDQNNRNILNTNLDNFIGQNNGLPGSKISKTSNEKSKVKEEECCHPANQIIQESIPAVVAESKTNASRSEECIAGVSNWKMESDLAYGISVSLYENNLLTKEAMGSPIADCYGIVVRSNVAVMALADGVNWGDGARLAARSAVHGCLDYLDRAIFGNSSTDHFTNTTQKVFVSLLRSLWEGHDCILEVGGALSTLTIAVVLPLQANETAKEEEKQTEQYVVCACNVGDSLGYIYSKKHGVREFTIASHDITSMRDMRDALGALGPANGNKPELSNLTLSMTVIDSGDIVFLTSDGISDNFDPVVGKFAEAWSSDVQFPANCNGRQSMKHQTNIAAKRQHRNSSVVVNHQTNSVNSATDAKPVRPPRTKKSDQTNLAIDNNTNRPKYMRSQTVIEAGSFALHNHSAVAHSKLQYPLPIPRSITGLPLVTGRQRHQLTLYRLEDLLSYGINGKFSPCCSARRLCHLLIDFVRMITSARRKTLEQRELFYKVSIGVDGNKREIALNRMQHRAARRRVIDSTSFAALPGKLDHATVVAYLAGQPASNEITVSVAANEMHLEEAKGKEEKNVNNQNLGNLSPSCKIEKNTLNGKSKIAPLQAKDFQETNF